MLNFYALHYTGCANEVHISPTFYEQFFCTKVFCAAFFYLQFGFVNFWQKNIGKKYCPKICFLDIVEIDISNNYSNILQAPCEHADHKSAKRQLRHHL